jgi:hypothetical protein
MKRQGATAGGQVGEESYETWWMSERDPKVALGDAFYSFVIEVVE